MTVKSSLDLNFLLFKMKKGKCTSFTEVYSRSTTQLRITDFYLFSINDFMK